MAYRRFFPLDGVERRDHTGRATWFRLGGAVVAISVAIGPVAGRDAPVGARVAPMPPSFWLKNRVLAPKPMVPSAPSMGSDELTLAW